MDRNSVIGFSLLVILLIGYIYYNQYSKSQYEEQKHADSVASAKAHPKPLADTSAVADTVAQSEQEVAMNDSIAATLPAAFRGEAQKVVMENKDIKLEFTTKGAHPVSALLKQYKTYEQKPLYLFDGDYNKFSAVLPINDGATATGDLYYTSETSTTEEGYQSIVFTADLGSGKKVFLTYTLPKEGYMLQCNLQLEGMNTTALPVTWQTQALHTEKDLRNERNSSQIYYKFTNDDEDYFTINSTDKKTLEDPTRWVGFRLHFFTTALVSENGMDRVNITGDTKSEDSSIVAMNSNTFEMPLKEKSADFQWYIGPNHYNTLRSYGIGLEEMVPLGYGPMFFVKYINKGLIIPIFNLLSKFISNYGIIIMLLTIIIRLLLSFFTYKSYLSAAKMRVLKPELDELREKFKGDQQKFGMEQMKLYREAGVNPLGGCLPTLFQLPILFAMFYFFPSSIELRQESFLWANDLSTYDSIFSWDAQIPVLSSIYGNHISLFTILMTVSSLFLALYNRNMTAQDPNNPMLKYLPFIFPFMLLGVFNKMAAALTFYYFFSNLISIAQQFIIQKYVINEEAIHAKIQENKNKPASKSKWQERLEEMQKAQVERAKQQPRKKK
ncbi:MAG: membrane protein insertase YidC [Chitinophagales bacterium]|nr:membrane protein insertase YidC [Chitinophagaceae bacterium]MCB9064006.1 membrane protein insertase YidC [Chitinophagales bacterium]